MNNADKTAIKKTPESFLQILLGDPNSPWWGGAGSPLLAAGLNLVLPGLGQLYNREPIRGLFYLVGSFLLWFVLLGWLVHTIAFLDPIYRAYRKASKAPPEVV